MSETTLPATVAATGTELVLYNEAREIDDRADSDMRGGLIVAGLFFVGFLGWAGFARMDAAAYAPARLVVSGQRQTVQHRDGGVVGALYVREGQKVAKGQLLIELTTPEIRAQERALAAQLISLKAQRARLIAEQLGTSVIAWPAEFATADAADLPEIEAAKRLQQSEFRTRAAVLGAQKGVLREQTAQVAGGSEGYRQQMAASVEQERLITEEIDSLRDLADKGYVSKTRMRALERARAALAGQREEYRANIVRSASAAGENRVRALEAETTFRERGAAQLREVEFALNDLMPKYNAAREQVARLSVRAPAGGTIVGMSVFTVGGVVAPGQKLMDIVPERTPLVIEARVALGDADDVRVGQTAQVRFPGLNDRSQPQFEGKVTRISADSFTDEKTGQSFYTAEVVVPQERIEAIRRELGRDVALRAGQPAQILIPLRKRTALQYAIEPLTDSLWKAFREN